MKDTRYGPVRSGVMGEAARWLLLDLDGTLTDSRSGIVASYTAALVALGHAPDPGLNLTSLIGPPIEEAMAAMLAAYGDDRVQEAVAAYRAEYGVRGYLDNAVYEGVPEMLEAASSAGWRLCLATSKRLVFAERILHHFNLSRFFQGIYGSIPGGSLDHKTPLIANIIRREGIAPSRAIMVGDRLHDVVGAHANGLPALGACWGYGEPTELARAGAEWLLADPRDLTRMIRDGSLAALRRG